jgi:hypothetical protein
MVLCNLVVNVYVFIDAIYIIGINNYQSFQKPGYSTSEAYLIAARINKQYVPSKSMSIQGWRH